MRSLPWLTDGSEPSGTVKRKRPTSSSKKSSLESGQVKREEPSESSSDSDDTTILDNSADNAYDAMIQGYGHDDAYIMVEHDLIEAAKQITRHIHLEAYQKQVTAPITGEIMRPTTGKPKPVVEGESEEDEEVGGKDVSTLGELLRRRPTATLLPATPIKKKEVRSVETVDVKTIDLTLDGSQHKKDVSIRNKITRRVIIKENRNMSQDATYDDDEDLDKPPAKILKRSTQISRTSSKLSNTTTASTSSKPSNVKKPLKPATKELLDPDWMFNSLWDDAPRASRPSTKRDKVSLAAQLDESSLKLFSNKKAISLKDQFKFMES